MSELITFTAYWSWMRWYLPRILGPILHVGTRHSPSIMAIFDRGAS